MNNEKTELIRAIVENDTVKKLKVLENYIENNESIQEEISNLILKQKAAISSNNQEQIASLLNQIDVLKTDINLIEYLNVQDEINELLINIRNIIESNLKG